MNVPKQDDLRQPVTSETIMQVLTVYPEARCIFCEKSDVWCVTEKYLGRVIGEGDTQLEAWADSASKLPKQDDQPTPTDREATRVPRASKMASFNGVIDKLTADARAKLAQPDEPQKPTANLPIDEKFVLYRDDEGDFVIEAQRQKIGQYLVAHGESPTAAVEAMCETLCLAASLPTPARVEQPASEGDCYTRMCQCGHNLITHAVSGRCIAQLCPCLRFIAPPPPTTGEAGTVKSCKKCGWNHVYDDCPHLEHGTCDGWPDVHTRDTHLRDDPRCINFAPTPTPAPVGDVEQAELPLNHMNRNQYDSWVRKAEDPDWYDHRYHQDKQDRALVSFARELRDTRCTLRAERAAHKATRSYLEGVEQTSENRAQALMAWEETANKSQRKVAELEAALNNSKLPKMFVWHGRGKWVAMAHAFSVAEARELLLEEAGTTDGSCPVRARAIEEIRSENPTIFYSSNAEFHLTDSGELEEAEAYSETLKLRAQIAEAKLAAVRETLNTPSVMDIGFLLDKLREIVK